MKGQLHVENNCTHVQCMKLYASGLQVVKMHSLLQPNGPAHRKVPILTLNKLVAKFCYCFWVSSSISPKFLEQGCMKIFFDTSMACPKMVCLSVKVIFPVFLYDPLHLVK